MGQVRTAAWTGGDGWNAAAAKPVGLKLRVATALLVMLALLTALLDAPAFAAAPSFPPLTGRIVDQANILSAGDKAEIEGMLKALDAKATDQLVVVTVRSLEGYPIEDYGYQLGRFWKIGQAGTNNGVLLIVAPNDKKVRIEVGRGLEPIMTDTMSKIIIDNAILPAFRRGDFSGGIKAGVRDMRDVLLGDAEAVKERAKSIRKRSSGGDIDYVALAFILFWVAATIYSIYQHRKEVRQMPAGYRPGNRRAGRGGNVVVIPGSWGGSGGWSGGSSGGGSSDGGFSGGGGDFGGGGSSGSW